MKRMLSIIRHGKSSWDNESLEDIHRPLAPRGIRNAEEMALRMKKRGTVPDLLFSSPASRALHTALIMSRTWELGPEALQIHEPLYLANETEIEEVISHAPQGIEHLAVFGHNPSFTLFANLFLELPLDNLPTAGIVTVAFASERWGKITRVKPLNTFVDYPKKGK